MIRHLDEHRSIADTDGMQMVTRRRPATIRLVCRDIRTEDGYDVDQAAALLAQHQGEVVLVTAAQAEQYLAIPANRIYQWVHRKLLKPTDRLGRSPRYSVADLERLNCQAESK